MCTVLWHIWSCSAIVHDARKDELHDACQGLMQLMVILMQGYQHSITMIQRESNKVPGRREEALASASCTSRPLSNKCCKRRSRPRKVGHHAAVPRPKHFYVRLDEDDLYMLVIPEELGIT